MLAPRHLRWLSVCLLLVSCGDPPAEPTVVATHESRLTLALDHSVGEAFVGTGVPLLSPAGVAFSNDAGWIAWSDSRVGVTKTWVRTLDATGNPNGPPIDTQRVSNFMGRASLGAVNGQFLLAGVRFDVSTVSYFLEGSRLGSTGLFDPAPVTLQAPVNWYSAPLIAPLDGGFLVRWREPNRAASRLVATTGSMSPVTGLLTTSITFTSLAGAETDPEPWLGWTNTVSPFQHFASPVQANGTLRNPGGVVLYSEGTPSTLHAVTPVTVAGGPGLGLCLAEVGGGLITMRLRRTDTAGLVASEVTQNMGGGTLNAVLDELQAIATPSGEVFCTFSTSSARGIARFNATGGPSGSIVYASSGSTVTPFGNGMLLVNARNNPGAQFVSVVPAAGAFPDGGWEWMPTAAEERPLAVGIGGLGVLVITEEDSKQGRKTLAHFQPLDDRIGATDLDVSRFSVRWPTTLLPWNGGFALVTRDTTSALLGVTLIDETGLNFKSAAINTSNHSDLFATDAGLAFTYEAHPTDGGSELRLFTDPLDGGPTTDVMLGELPVPAVFSMFGMAATHALGAIYVSAEISNSGLGTCEIYGRVLGGSRDDGGIARLHTINTECGGPLVQVVDSLGWTIAWNDETGYGYVTLADPDGTPLRTTRIKAIDGGSLLSTPPALAIDSDGGRILYAGGQYDQLWTQAFSMTGAELDGSVQPVLANPGTTQPIVAPYPGGFVLAYDAFDPRSGAQIVRSRFRVIRTRPPEPPIITAPLDQSSVLSPVGITVASEPFAYVTLMINGADAGTRFTSGPAVAQFTSTLAPGSYSATAIAADYAGQLSPWSNAVSWTVLAPDAGVDAGTLDAGTPDAGVDAGSSDAGELDAGLPDSGVDAGDVDAGAVDAGAIDSGIQLDAGTLDAGVPDAGVTDGGTDSISRALGVGCGCQHVDVPPLVLLGLSLLGLRRRRTNG